MERRVVRNLKVACPRVPSHPQRIAMTTESFDFDRLLCRAASSVARASSRDGTIPMQPCRSLSHLTRSGVLVLKSVRGELARFVLSEGNRLRRIA